MREQLLQIVTHPAEVHALLAEMDRNSLEKGILRVTPSMLNALAAIFCGKSVKMGPITVNADGAICFALRTQTGMQLSYQVLPLRFSARNGCLEGEIAYAEQRQGGGLGQALLSVSGKTGLAFALGKYPWCRVTDDRVFLSYRGIPGYLWGELVRCDGQGVTLRIR